MTILHGLFHTDEILPRELLGVYSTQELALKAKATYISEIRHEEDFSIEDVYLDRVAKLPEGKQLYCYYYNTLYSSSVTEQIEPFEEGNRDLEGGNVDFVNGEIINQVVVSGNLFKVFVWASSHEDAEAKAKSILKARYII